jgi:hypothetical protein
VAGPEVSEPPEVIGPVDGVANPAGKSDAGSSTDSSCVPVSCPAAAAIGVIDADGDASGPPEAPEAPEPPEVAVAAADGAEAAAGDELPEDEDVQPATVKSTPAIAVSKAAARRSPRTTKDDTELPTPELDPDS